MKRAGSPSRLLFLAMIAGAMSACGTHEDGDSPGADAGEGASSDGGGDDDGGAAGDQQPPNILLVIADDFGVDASPCYSEGVDKPSMPTLESLCASGVVFEHAWATPECSPTRAQLITGRFGFQTGVGSAGDRLDSDETSLQELITQGSPHGYASAVIGKWHLAGVGAQDFDHPATLGVPHFAGLFTGALPDYYHWTQVVDGQSETVDEYATTVFTDESLAWIEQQTTPWFLWLSYTAPHTPLHVPPADLQDRSDLTGTPADIAARPRDYYFAAAEALDHELGRLLENLPAGQRERTIILFMGDNGTFGQVIQTPYTSSQSKSTLYEGGVRVPLVVAGPGVARVGEREPALVSSVDLFATIAELAGVAQPTGTSSISLVPYFGSAGTASARAIDHSEYFRGNADLPDDGAFGWTVRDDRYHLMVLDSGARYLFDLQEDPEEQTDLSASPEHQDDVDRLESAGLALRGQ